MTYKIPIVIYPLYLSIYHQMMSLPSVPENSVSNQISASNTQIPQEEKSEFYWKLHSLTLKIRDYVSKFKTKQKLNPIEEIMMEAMRNHKSNRKMSTITKRSNTIRVFNRSCKVIESIGRSSRIYH